MMRRGNTPEAGRGLRASGRLSLGLSLGYAFYRDIDCFSFSGSLGNQIETTTLTEKSGVVRTLISQPEFVGNESDLVNPDGTFGGDTPSGLPIAPGWSTPILTLSPDRF